MSKSKIRASLNAISEAMETETISKMRLVRKTRRVGEMVIVCLRSGHETIYK
jgi:hypothetical protein